MLLARLLGKLVRDGALTLIDADGSTYRLGRSSRGSDLVIRLHDPGLRYAIPLAPFERLGQAYVDGTLTLERGDAFELFDLYARNVERIAARSGGLWERAIARIGTSLGRPREEAADVLHDLFLDRDRQPSCAYFADPRASLEEAEEAMKQHLTAKLLLRPGQSVLDVGSRGGGLALHLAEQGGVDVTAIARSAPEIAVARRRSVEAALAGRVSFHERDLGRETGRYDRVVSVGALERVGAAGYPAFFTRLREVLAGDGVAVLRSIARASSKGARLPFLRPPLFEAGIPPALSEILPSIERARLLVTDVEILRLHPAEALCQVRRRLVSRWEEASRLSGDRLCRRLLLDLSLAEVGFRRGGLVVLEIQLARRADAVPITREYVYPRASAEDGASGLAA